MTERLPRISVVTPSYNQAKFLTATMESIHSQNYPDLEHIVIDGGSTDGSVEIIERYADKLTYWISEPDNGQTDAIAKGFDRATGEIFCWLNSDDLLEPWTLAEVAEYFNKNPEVEFVYGDSLWIDDEGTTIKPKREHGFSHLVWFYDHNFLPQPSSFWRRGLYERVGGVDRSFENAMDADLWARFAAVTRPRHVRRPWSRMRWYPEQKNTARRDVSKEELSAVQGRYIPDDPRVVRLAKHSAARIWRVVLKLGNGGYPPSELVRHLGLVTGRGSWEQQEKARAAGRP